MAYSEDHIALAAEYALGTLDAIERAEVETMMAADQGYAAIVQSWELRFGVLNQMVGLVEPPPELWGRIKAAVAGDPQQPAPLDDSLSPTGAAQTEPQGVIDDAAPSQDVPALVPSELPTAVTSEHDNAEQQGAVEIARDVPRASEPSQAAEPRHATGPAMLARATRRRPVNDNANVVALTAKMRRWRRVANAMTAVAAVLLATIAVQVYQPDLLPAGLRPKQRPQVAQVSAPPGPPAQYVALLQKDGASPAFILTVDAGSKTFAVRRVGAAVEPGKSYELWLVSDKLQRPRSLGVIGGSDFTVRPALAAYDADTVNRATYAVTIEPEGGSPTGVATGPIVFSGQLIETVPPAR